LIYNGLKIKTLIILLVFEKTFDISGIYKIKIKFNDK